MIYKSPPVGIRIDACMYGINEELIKNNTKLEEMLYSALKEENFHIVNKLKVEFKPQGLTLVVILAESHTIIHTFPEYGSLTFDLYSCRGPNDGRKTYNYFKEKVNPTSVDLKIKKVIVDPRYRGKYTTLDKIIKTR